VNVEQLRCLALAAAANRATIRRIPKRAGQGSRITSTILWQAKGFLKRYGALKSMSRAQVVVPFHFGLISSGSLMAVGLPRRFCVRQQPFRNSHGLCGAGRFLRQPEFESEERVGSAIFEVDDIAVHVAGESDRADDAEHAEVVLGDWAKLSLVYGAITFRRTNVSSSV